MNYELIIFYAIITCGLIVLIDKYLLRDNCRKNKFFQMITSNAFSLFPVLLCVFSIRSFAYEPYRVPTGSLKPTVQVGDFLLVNKYQYGIRLPVIHKKIFNINEPKRGDIVVFHTPSKDYPPIMVKRVVGLPGDHLKYINKVLYVNGQKANQTFVKFSTDSDDNVYSWQVNEMQENLLGVKHDIYHINSRRNDNFEVTVPKGKYFMMGDNRDDSADSRYWGVVPEENIVGQVTRILISVDNFHHPLRVERTGQKII